MWGKRRRGRVRLSKCETEKGQMEEWTGMERRPENKIKTGRNQGRREKKRLTSGNSKGGGRKTERKERGKQER